MKRLALLTVVALVVVVPRAARAQAPAAAAAPHVTASVDRTAVWVADRVTYTIRIVCEPGVDVLLDDLAKEKLRATGLDVVGSDASDATDADGRTTHELRYVLTTYHVDTPALSIEPMSVRYYARRPGQRLQDVAPAGEVQVPGAAIAFRSTLPENQQTYALRDNRPPAARQRFAARAQQFGLALVVLSLAPAAFVGSATWRRRTAGRPVRRSARRARQDQRAAMERLRALDVSSDTARRAAYDEISAAVRGHLAAQARLPAAALTAAEIDAALAASHSRVPRETVATLLTSCDEARYAPPEQVPSAEACRDALTTAEQVLEAR